MSIGSRADPSLDSQPTGDSHEPGVGCDLSARPAVTFPAREHHRPVVSIPKDLPLIKMWSNRDTQKSWPVKKTKSYHSMCVTKLIIHNRERHGNGYPQKPAVITTVMEKNWPKMWQYCGNRCLSHRNTAETGPQTMTILHNGKRFINHALQALLL